MRRSETSREDLIANVVDAWNAVPGHAKPDLMNRYPSLYAAAAWLAAHENCARWTRKTWKAEG